ncbi:MULTISPECIES: zinc metallopeptidase [Aerococcus]|uniref:zinc metallopeptidase n=1 Tax=Aerococcus urinae (strain CCUG 59500 / ACS-120-V-Col10a) TaxID=2976812 RepID=UPI000200E58C|nr:zinc metallopeptidase [Aerococcus sp. Group 1]AEA00545.1 putative neutral zinc metallopeptidase [Aerococcus sp. Group 1]MCY3030064.1 zinc metallopeptidase [Aerococcus sp. Group 1]MCY3054377.1 zinc metallopeptidase [Aerococcus sp. Group 1]MCY3056107.1 zinc metallopeptidase [Aerococcus sp. Group 1]MCY3061138.1 zinc metallopeptidase [Aerococcus sp. Group 1]
MFGFPLFYMFDPTIILLIIGAIIAGIASWNVNRTFDKYSRYTNRRGLTADQVARMMLDHNQIGHVGVSSVRGKLTDYYDPRDKNLYLSDQVSQESSISAIGVAAHECGHALQDADNYAFMRIREKIVPVVNFGSSLSMPILLLGVLFGMNQTLINIGIALFSLALLFQLVTLPVEFDASRRAIRCLDEMNILSQEELPYAKSTLRAAALTYVAGTVSTLLSLLRIIILFGGNRRD